MVEYGYDAWGKPTKVWSLTHPSESTLTSEYGKLAQLNPFRYRGYVWDEETGLYYLRSRYYDPAWGRFLSIDAQLGSSEGNPDHNLYAYCGNNAICRIDSDGTAYEWYELPYMGYIHWQVQLHIQATNPKEAYRREEPVRYRDPQGNLKLGRIDIFSPISGECWEIKPFTVSPDIAEKQLNGYINGQLVNKYTSVKELKPGTGCIEGKFITSDQRFRVSYYTTQKGVIQYSFSVVRKEHSRQVNWDQVAVSLAAVGIIAVLGNILGGRIGGRLVLGLVA